VQGCTPYIWWLLWRPWHIAESGCQIGGSWRRGLTWRSLGVGTLLVVAECVLAPNAIWNLGSSEVTWSYMPCIVVFPFFVVVVANAGVKAMRREWALRQAELVVVFAMPLASAGTPLFLIGFLLALMASPYYVASAENRWAELLHPHLPRWAFPSDDGDAMRWLFEGLPEGQAIPWGAWLGPLAWWMALIVAFFFVCLCMVVLLRRQWVERERLVAQTGVAYVTPPMVAQPALLFGMGTASLSPRSLTGLACAYGWHGDVQTTFMVGAAQDAKLAGDFRVRGRSLLPALGVSVVVGLVASVVFILAMAYTKGAARLLHGHRSLAGGRCHLVLWPGALHLQWVRREESHE